MSDRLDQVSGRHRLGQVQAKLRSTGDDFRVIVVLGQESDRREMVELVEQGKSVDPRHVHVQEDGTDVSGPQKLDGGISIGRLVNDVARGPQDLGAGGADVVVVTTSTFEGKAITT